MLSFFSIHDRIGRVGRTSKMGLAISIVAPSMNLSVNTSSSDDAKYTENTMCMCCSSNQFCSTHLSSTATSDSSSASSSSDWQEKVWFHTCSNRGKGCLNRKLKSDGGCTIWYNESVLLDNVKERLHMEPSERIPELSVDDFSLPAALAELGIVYGEDTLKSDESNSFGGTSSTLQMRARLNKLSGTVKDLSSMEHEAQNIFLLYKTQFTSTMD